MQVRGGGCIRIDEAPHVFGYLAVAQITRPNRAEAAQIIGLRLVLPFSNLAHLIRLGILQASGTNCLTLV